jgi:hypothetical protein
MIELYLFVPLVFILPQLAGILAPLVWLPLHALIAVINWGAALPYAQLTLTSDWQKLLAIGVFAIIILILFELEYRIFKNV